MLQEKLSNQKLVSQKFFSPAHFPASLKFTALIPSLMERKLSYINKKTNLTIWKQTTLIHRKPTFSNITNIFYNIKP